MKTKQNLPDASRVPHQQNNTQFSSFSVLFTVQVICLEINFHHIQFFNKLCVKQNITNEENRADHSHQPPARTQAQTKRHLEMLHDIW